MKNIIVILTVVFAFTSCKKSESTATPTTTTVDVTVPTNQTYRYNFGNVNPSDIIVTTAATHAAGSKVAFVSPQSDSTAFVFVPDSNYTGTDQVIITVQGGHNCDHSCNHPDKGNCTSQCHHNKGNCKNKPPQNDGKAGMKYILNFKVTGVAN